LHDGELYESAVRPKKWGCMIGERIVERIRFWIPIILLLGFNAYISYRLVRAHIDPRVQSINYAFERDLPGCRGTIYDGCGNGGCPLVKSVPVWKYYLDPVDLTNHVVRPKGEAPRSANAILKTISRTLDLDYQKLLKMSQNSRKRSQELATSSDPKAHLILTNPKLVSGIAVQELQLRKYLHNRSLAHVLGSVNKAHVGSAGIELKFDKELRGVPGKLHGMKDALRREVYDKRIGFIDPIPGDDIYLTIDHNIQYEAETALADGLKKFGAATGWCVVLDTRTGAVLALASLPDFDPDTFGRAPDAAKINRVTNLTYEPGSVMKVITACAGIDSHIVTPNTTYSTNRDDDRYYRLPGDGRHVWDPRMSVRDAVVHSSNIVIGKLGYDLGPERLWTYMRAFGFGSPTGIELPGEEAGILPNWKRWDKVKWSRAPIGQGVSVTALQLASAYQAIANDGTRMRPYIIDKIIAADGTVMRHNEPQVVGHPITPSTARQAREMMLGVASPKGTARRAAIRGYSVAGKTGTAQKVINGRYSDHLFYATFCGIVPASEPRLVILVTLDFEERRQFHQGGNSAAPIFQRIATAALRYLMIPPDRPDELSEFTDDDEFDKIMEERALKAAAEMDDE
jgi:cell division protein FtsI/penicillin-binding protein 2